MESIADQFINKSSLSVAPWLEKAVNELLPKFVDRVSIKKEHYSKEEVLCWSICVDEYRPRVLLLSGYTNGLTFKCEPIRSISYDKKEKVYIVLAFKVYKLKNTFSFTEMYDMIKIFDSHHCQGTNRNIVSIHNETLDSKIRFK
jgi:hypothetical protein